MFRLLSLSVVVLVCAAPACIDSSAEDPSTEEVEQGVTTTFLLRSVSVPNQIVDVLLPQSGALARLGPLSAVPGQQRWVFDGIRLHSSVQQQLCLQPETAAAGARLILRPCETSADTLQQWAGLRLTNGHVSMGDRVTNMYIDASAGAFGLLRQQPRSHLLPQEFVLAP
jgi:hypothetical protein